MGAIWFTADHHFGHLNIIHYCNRPFSTVDEMDACLIERWNELVMPGDTVYHLGDFCLGDLEMAKQYFSQLNGRIRVLGSAWHHDRRWLPLHTIHSWHAKVPKVGCCTRIWTASNHSVEILPPMWVLEKVDIVMSQPCAIVLCHYPLAVWDRRHYGSVHLHGHSHGQYVIDTGLIMDVGVDSHNFAPVSLGMVIAMMRERARLALS